MTSVCAEAGVCTGRTKLSLENISTFDQRNFLSSFSGAVERSRYPSSLCVHMWGHTHTPRHKMLLCGGGNVSWQPWRNQEYACSSTNMLPVRCYHSYGLIVSDGSTVLLYASVRGEGTTPASPVFPPVCILIHFQPTPLCPPNTHTHWRNREGAGKSKSNLSLTLIVYDIFKRCFTGCRC